jgi:hypothetical protein
LYYIFAELSKVAKDEATEGPEKGIGVSEDPSPVAGKYDSYQQPASVESIDEVIAL